LLAAPQYRTALTPTDYQAGVVVELHPSHMTTEAGLVLVGSWNLSFAATGVEGASPCGYAAAYSHLMIHSAGAHLAVFTEAALHGPSQNICPVTSYSLFHHRHFIGFHPNHFYPLTCTFFGMAVSLD